MKRWQALATLLLIVIIWGTTFIIVRDTVKRWDPIASVALKFLIATACVLPWALGELRRWRRADWLAALTLGGLLYGGFITQTIGLTLISASRSGFLTGLNVVLVPMFGALIWRERVHPKIWAGLALVVSGLWLLGQDHNGGDQAGSLLGDGLVLTCAVLFAAHILAVARLSPGRSLLALNAAQLLVVTVLASGTSLLFEGVPSWPGPEVWWAMLYLGVIATALVMGMQIAAQQVVSPTETALIFVLEPVFAALFAVLFGNEQLSTIFLLGGGVMIAGIVLAEVPPVWFSRRSREQPHDAL